MGGHPCLVPDCRGEAFSSILLRIMLAVGLSYMAFIYFLMCLEHFMVLQSIFTDTESSVILTVTLCGRGYDARFTGERVEVVRHIGTLFRILQGP